MVIDNYICIFLSGSTTKKYVQTLSTPFAEFVVNATVRRGLRCVNKDVMN